MMIEVVLFGAPMGKQRGRTTGNSTRIYTPEKTLRFEAALAHEASIVMRGRPLLDGPLVVDVLAYMPVPISKPKAWREDALAGRIAPTKKPDFDNIAKLVDGLNMVVWVDDAQIVDGRSRKFYSDRPRFVVRVRPWAFEPTVQYGLGPCAEGIFA
ncbi:MAG: RusA family crossover junction endodeoxyribonuclease [Hyphomicrobium sp.]|jgi:Holliday junction resolvase RusA-like endonuclease